MLPGESITYLSADSVSCDNSEEAQNYPIEFHLYSLVLCKKSFKTTRHIKPPGTGGIPGIRKCGKKGIFKIIT